MLVLRRWRLSPSCKSLSVGISINIYKYETNLILKQAQMNALRCSSLNIIVIREGIPLRNLVSCIFQIQQKIQNICPVGKQEKRGMLQTKPPVVMQSVEKLWFREKNNDAWINDVLLLFFVFLMFLFDSSSICFHEIRDKSWKVLT